MIIQKYIDYIKDNPEGYWFKRKVFGWGWTPAKWQGWIVVAAYMVILFMLAFTVDEGAEFGDLIFTFLGPLVLSTFVLFWIAYKKGEKPKWMWGLPKKEEGDTPVEDKTERKENSTLK